MSPDSTDASADYPRQAWVFAGGEFSVSHLPEQEVDGDDLIVCVDRGLEHCLTAGYKPSMLIGDLDSVSPELLIDERVADVPRHVYPSKKAASDLEITLELLSERNLQRVMLLGVSGGRTDHMLFNWQLPLLRRWPFQLQLIDATTRCYVLRDNISVTLYLSIGQLVSLLPLTTVKGVTTGGLQYALTQATLSIGSTLGLSNVVAAGTVNVELCEGTLLVMVNTADEHSTFNIQHSTFNIQH